ncbi:hypothetical protein BD324DRAFT_608911 [Kockovaella imperatae]|uniref:GATA-type domain-containing protein n=1 Tax=Kockovaella imperatae TaxID=4999 RepID=A0A1Y1UFV8_9TREE|nr:hypothetical protein BD324DRAFT_608911 [Kockovaella imperatae]ORX36941.1 hypothetical protein BD324DRAFT_608911 [Kockovaella imperatae]
MDLTLDSLCDFLTTPCVSPVIHHSTVCKDSPSPPFTPSDSVYSPSGSVSNHTSLAASASASFSSQKPTTTTTIDTPGTTCLPLTLSIPISCHLQWANYPLPPPTLTIYSPKSRSDTCFSPLRTTTRSATPTTTSSFDDLITPSTTELPSDTSVDIGKLLESAALEILTPTSKVFELLESSFHSPDRTTPMGDIKAPSLAAASTATTTRTSYSEQQTEVYDSPTFVDPLDERRTSLVQSESSGENMIAPHVPTMLPPLRSHEVSPHISAYHSTAGYAHNGQYYYSNHSMGHPGSYTYQSSNSSAYTQPKYHTSLYYGSMTTPTTQSTQSTHSDLGTPLTDHHGPDSMNGSGSVGGGYAYSSSQIYGTIQPSAIQSWDQTSRSRLELGTGVSNTSGMLSAPSPRFGNDRKTISPGSIRSDSKVSSGGPMAAAGAGADWTRPSSAMSGLSVDGDHVGSTGISGAESTLIGLGIVPGTVQYTSEAEIKQTDDLKRMCFNCRAIQPPSWRKSVLYLGKILCNMAWCRCVGPLLDNADPGLPLECGIYERTHRRPRPPQNDEQKLRRGSVSAAQIQDLGVDGRSAKMPSARLAVMRENGDEDGDSGQDSPYSTVPSLESYLAPVHRYHPSPYTGKNGLDQWAGVPSGTASIYRRHSQAASKRKTNKHLDHRARRPHHSMSASQSRPSPSSSTAFLRDGASQDSDVHVHGHGHEHGVGHGYGHSSPYAHAYARRSGYISTSSHGLKSRFDHSASLTLGGESNASVSHMGRSIYSASTSTLAYDRPSLHASSSMWENGSRRFSDGQVMLPQPSILDSMDQSQYYQLPYGTTTRMMQDDTGYGNTTTVTGHSGTSSKMRDQASDDDEPDRQEYQRRDDGGRIRDVNENENEDDGDDADEDNDEEDDEEEDEEESDFPDEDDGGEYIPRGRA